MQLTKYGDMLGKVIITAADAGGPGRIKGDTAALTNAASPIALIEALFPNTTAGRQAICGYAGSIASMPADDISAAASAHQDAAEAGWNLKGVEALLPDIENPVLLIQVIFFEPMLRLAGAVCSILAGLESTMALMKLDKGRGGAGLGGHYPACRERGHPVANSTFLAGPLPWRGPWRAVPGDAQRAGLHCRFPFTAHRGRLIAAFYSILRIIWATGFCSSSRICWQLFLVTIHVLHHEVQAFHTVYFHWPSACQMLEHWMHSLFQPWF